MRLHTFARTASTTTPLFVSSATSRQATTASDERIGDRSDRGMAL
jgi:hypothetical protein